MKEARIKVPLQVSAVGSANVMPLTIHECTKILSGLDGEVRNPQFFLRSPNMRKKSELRSPTKKKLFNEEE
jgi:hypothetical protein